MTTYEYAYSFLFVIFAIRHIAHFLYIRHASKQSQVASHIEESGNCFAVWKEVSILDRVKDPKETIVKEDYVYQLRGKPYMYVTLRW